ncbi:MAG: squalene/phytoene synthase family protein [Pseudomonadota bacterium]
MSAAAIDIADARRHAEATVKKSGTSFAAGMSILPRKRREAMHAIYAFCREVDDIADDGGLTQQERLEALDGWRTEIDRLYDGVPELPTGVALLEPVNAFDLPKQEFILLIEGMEMDAKGPIVAPTMEQLFAYTRRVAGAVGMLSMPTFGAQKGEASDRFALSLADALQLTNILRDVAEDARVGRLYLPAELLEKHGAPMEAAVVERVLTRQRSDHEDDLRGGEDGGSRPALQAVAHDLAEVAKQKFADARAALKDLDWRTVRPALLMMGVYEAYLKKLEARGWDKIGEPLSMLKAEKILISVRYALAPPIGRA